jgi:hypothetical protein
MIDEIATTQNGRWVTAYDKRVLTERQEATIMVTTKVSSIVFFFQSEREKLKGRRSRETPKVCLSRTEDREGSMTRVEDETDWSEEATFERRKLSSGKEGSRFEEEF